MAQITRLGMRPVGAFTGRTKPISRGRTLKRRKWSPAHGSMHATDEPVNTTSLTPFGKDYRGGVSLATGWLAGSLGGAKRIIVSQLTDKGSVKIFSSGSALDGGPSLYLLRQPMLGTEAKAGSPSASR